MSILSKLFQLLSKKQAKQFLFLQILVIVTALLESISVVAIAPLMTAVTNPGSLLNNQLFVQIKHQFVDLSVSTFIIYYSIIFLIILFFANFLSILTIWLLSVFAARFGAQLSDRLYELYSSMNYLRFISLGSDYITKQVSTEVSRLTDNVLQPIVQINARVFSGSIICVILFIYNPFAAVLSFLIFSIAYIVIFYFVKQKLNTNGKNLSIINQSRFRFISEGFGAFREIKSFEASDAFSKRFSESSSQFSKAYSTLNTIYNAPRYIIEYFVFATLIFLIIKYNSNNNSIEFLAVISVFGLAALKLLPIFQQIYSCAAQVRGHKNSLDLIYKDLISQNYLSDLENEKKSDFLNEEKNNNETVTTILELRGLSFHYISSKQILNNINLTFQKGSKVAIIGKSGAGKSTLSDIVTGLLLPTKGKLIFKGKEINNQNLHVIRKNISLVPQAPFILQGTFINNVSFSFETIENVDKVSHVLNQVGLLEFILSLKEGLNTIIGDGNMQLSGGQKQRLAIARALYKDSDIIFFDEPTSSLDPESETDIVDLINTLAPRKTIITITHKLTTIRNYDKILILHEGQIQQEGNFNNLINESDLFNKIMSTSN